MKIKRMIRDTGLNTLGFAIYIIAQQLILLPVISRFTTDEIYSNFVIYLSVLNIIANSTGGEVGNVRIVKDSIYQKLKINGDFFRILLYLAPLISFVGFVVFYLLGYSIGEIIILILTLNMANIRLYATCYFRLEQKFKEIIIQNILYFIGVSIGIGIMFITKNVYIAILIPEFITIIYSLLKSDLTKMERGRTIQFKETLKTFFQFALISLLTNCMAYYDRLLIYPILGASAVAVYYSTSTISKMVALITNPVSSVILAWVAKAKEENISKIIIKTIKANIPLLFLVAIVSIPTTYISIWILYRQHLEQAIYLIIPMSIATAFNCCASLTKSILLKVSNTKYIIYIYIVHFIFLSVIGYIGSKQGGVQGFTIATAISKMELWLSFMLLLVINLRGKNGRTKEEY